MNNLVKITGFLASLLLVTPSWAYTINSGDINVGELDNMLYSADDTEIANSGNGEQDWISGLLGGDYLVDLENKFEYNESFTPIAVDNETEIFAQDLGSYQEYFIVKLGGGNGNYSGDTHFLFQNVSLMSYGVFSFSQFLGTCSDESKCSMDITRVSHIANVPEPASLALMGLGLIGMGVASRRRKKF